MDTADISPTATADQKVAMERFLRGSPKRTEAIQTACVEICESKYDRLLLSVIDTPGLDFQEGHELKLERQVSTIVKYLDTQFADTLSEVRGYPSSCFSVCSSRFILSYVNECCGMLTARSGIKGRPSEQRRPTHSLVSARSFHVQDPT